MTKIAKLVYVTLLTRVIVEPNATEQDIMEEAIPKLSENLMDSPFENIDKIVDDVECPYTIGEEYSLSVGDNVEMPDPDDSLYDMWSFGGFIGSIVRFYDTNNIIYAVVEDGDGDGFDIEAERLIDSKI